MLLFAPLFNYLTLLPVRFNTDIPRPTALHQSLHNIISSAAYLSLCVRISPTIIHLSHLLPGTSYSPEEHTSIMQASWTFSKTLVQEKWTKDHALLETERAEAEGYRLGYERAHRLDSIAGRLAIQKLETAQNRLAMHRPPFYTHRASVKISVWPNTRRYWAGSGKPGGDMDGQSIFSLTNAGAIFYFKETDRPIEPLFDFVARKKKTFRGRHQRARDVMGIIGFLALGIILCLLYLLGPTAVLDWFKWIPTRLTAYLQSYIRRGRDEVYRGYGYFGAPGAARFESARKNPFEAFRDTAGKATDKVKEGYSAGASRAGDVYEKYARRSGH